MLDAHEIVRVKLKTAFDNNCKFYNRRKHHKVYQKGDNVLLYCPAKKIGVSPKITRFWQGIYTVIKVLPKSDSGTEEDEEDDDHILYSLAQHEQDQVTDGQPETELEETTESIPEEEESEVSDQELVLPEDYEEPTVPKGRERKKPQKYGDWVQQSKFHDLCGYHSPFTNKFE